MVQCPIDASYRLNSDVVCVCVCFFLCLKEHGSIIRNHDPKRRVGSCVNLRYSTVKIRSRADGIVSGGGDGR